MDEFKLRLAEVLANARAVYGDKAHIEQMCATLDIGIRPVATEQDARLLVQLAIRAYAAELAYESARWSGELQPGEWDLYMELKKISES